jgi:uncharacterized OsmC-like protein/alpha/beta superfamily hydrolase
MKSEKIKFENKEGIELSAQLDFPITGTPKYFAIFAHCFTCNKNLNAVRSISRALTNNQVAVMRMDFTGLGQSEGNFADSNFSSNISDLLSASDYLKNNFEAPELLIGHSLGGAAVLYCAGKIDSVKAIATIGAPSHPEHIENLFSTQNAEIEASGSAEVNIGGRPFKIKKQLIEDVKSIDYSFREKSIQPSLLIIHSPIDEVVEISNAKEIYEKARHPKSFISLDGADHLVNKKADAFYIGEVISSWAGRYLDSYHEDYKLETDKQVVVRTHSDSFTSELLAAGHKLIADEPIDVGGNNFGPGPYDLLLSSLGACTSMTLKMYLDRKEWDYTSIEVHLSHTHEHTEDAKNPENPSGKIDLIQREILINGNLNEEQKKKALEIADKCPVHRSLHSPTEVKTKWWSN